MVTHKNYIKANTPIIIENAIKFYLWYNKPIKETFNNSINHASQHFPGIDDELKKAIYQYYNKIISDIKDFETFVNTRRKTLIKPASGTIKHYLKNHWETSYSLQEIFNQLEEVTP